MLQILEDTDKAVAAEVLQFPGRRPLQIVGAVAHRYLLHDHLRYIAVLSEKGTFVEACRFYECLELLLVGLWRIEKLVEQPYRLLEITVDACQCQGHIGRRCLCRERGTVAAQQIAEGMLVVRFRADGVEIVGHGSQAAVLAEATAVDELERKDIVLKIGNGIEVDKL